MQYIQPLNNDKVNEAADIFIPTRDANQSSRAAVKQRSSTRIQEASDIFTPTRDAINSAYAAVKQRSSARDSRHFYSDNRHNSCSTRRH